jgi:hypothetical protein
MSNIDIILILIHFARISISISNMEILDILRAYVRGYRVHIDTHFNASHV